MRLLTLGSILVATDMGEASRPALRTAARLARLSGARLHLLHVADQPVADDEVRLIDHYHESVPEAPEPESLQLLAGDPARAIVEHAEAVGADAVVLGPHRRGGGGGEFGSTAATVVRTASCPCLVAASELHLPLGGVLVPIDLSGVADGTLSVALSWASALRQPGSVARLTALHVAAGGAGPEVERAVGDEVARAKERAGGAAYVEIVQSVLSGGTSPTEAILEAAGASGVHLLVMGTRGAEAGREGLGSVSAAVARATPCPLLLVPPRTWARYSERSA